MVAPELGKNMENSKIESAKQAVIERFGADSTYLYKVGEQKMVMNVDFAFEISGSHIQAGIDSGDDTIVQATWQRLEDLKVGADKLKALDENIYNQLLEAGRGYLEQWKQRQ